MAYAVCTQSIHGCIIFTIVGHLFNGYLSVYSNIDIGTDKCLEHDIYW